MHSIEPIEVARVNEQRQAAATRELAHESAPLAGGWMTFSPGVPWISHATGLALDEPLTEPDLDALESFYRDRGAPVKVELTIFAPEPALALLAARGYFVEHFETVLAREIGPGLEPCDLLPHGWPAGVEIRRTDPADEALCRLHSHLVACGFQAEPIPEPMIEMGVRAIKHPRSAAFMAFVDGEPAAGCGMEICEYAGISSCSLWGTTVREPFRRRGIQQALIAWRLAHALERGCRLAIIESKPGIPTERNAARLGFGLSYTRVCMARRDQ